MVKRAEFKFPGGLEIKLVDHPIAVPLIRRKGAGKYLEVLSEALKLKPTSIESGLSPHFEWPCESHRELRSRMISLGSTKRKFADKFGRLFFMQRSNPEEKTFTVYIWKEQ